MQTQLVATYPQIPPREGHCERVGGALTVLAIVGTGETRGVGLGGGGFGGGRLGGLNSISSFGNEHPSISSLSSSIAPIVSWNIHRADCPKTRTETITNIESKIVKIRNSVIPWPELSCLNCLTLSISLRFTNQKQLARTTEGNSATVNPILILKFFAVDDNFP